MANETPVSNIQLIGLQGQLEGVRTELVNTNNGLQGIATLIRTDSAQDQQRLLDERREQQLLYERQIRIGQEDALEQRVSSAFVEPVNKLEKNLSSTFGNIQKALNFLFTGVIGGVFLRGLSKTIDLGKIALSGVGSLLSNIFGAITNTLGFIGNGFKGIISSIGGVIGNISKSILSLATSPFKAVADAFGKILGRGPGASPSPTTPSSRPTSGLPRLPGLGLLARFVSGAGALSSATKGDVVGTGIYGSAALAPNLFTGGAALAYSFLGERERQGLNSALGNSMRQFSDSPIGSYFSGAANSLIDMGKNFFGISDDGVDLNAPAQRAEVPVVDTASNPTPGTPIPLTIAPFDESQVQSPPSQERNLEPLSEPTPDIVYLRSGNQQTSKTIASGRGTLTDVPLISSANADNFYTLYAQINYNVVM